MKVCGIVGQVYLVGQVAWLGTADKEVDKSESEDFEADWRRLEKNFFRRFY